MSLKNLKWKGGGANPSGIQSKVFAMLKSDITKFPALNETGSGYEGSFELIAAALALEIYSTQGKGKLDFEQIGEKDCGCFTNKGSFSYPDMDEEACLFVNNTLNDNYIFIAAMYNKGGLISWRVLGSQSMDCEVKITGTSGQKAGEAKGLTIEVSAPDYMALPIYVGTVKTSEGVFDCSTNTFAPAGA